MSQFNRIGVVGAGAMGAGIAQVAAMAGCDVLITDKKRESIATAQEDIQRSLNKFASKDKITPEQHTAILGRLHYVDSTSGFSDRDLVIEAIVENLDIKQAVFTDLEKIISPDCVLASNTSSLSIASIAGKCKHPERVVGLHFFNPAALMPLVEVIPALQTRPGLASELSKVMRQWGKLPVIAKDTPGFIVNRIARPFYGEAIRILEEGLADIATIDHAMTELGGFRMGPFTLMDFIGHDVNFAVTETVFEAFFYDPRYKPSFTQKRMVEAGYLGRKKDRGFYDYRDGAPVLKPSEDRELLDNVLWRILVMLINEAADALYLGIADRDDIDTAMTKGVNYPKGLLKWADEKGIQHCVDTLDRLQDEYREDRYRCSPLLRKMARDQQTFYGKG